MFARGLSEIRSAARANARAKTASPAGATRMNAWRSELSRPPSADSDWQLLRAPELTSSRHVTVAVST